MQFGRRMKSRILHQIFLLFFLFCLFFRQWNRTRLRIMYILLCICVFFVLFFYWIHRKSEKVQMANWNVMKKSKIYWKRFSAWLCSFLFSFLILQCNLHETILYSVFFFVSYQKINRNERLTNWNKNDETRKQKERKWNDGTQNPVLIRLLNSFSYFCVAFFCYFIIVFVSEIVCVLARFIFTALIRWEQVLLSLGILYFLSRDALCCYCRLFLLILNVVWPQFSTIIMF